MQTQFYGQQDIIERLENLTFVFFQNTALNLAAIAGNAPIVTYLLSVKDQKILMNSYNQNVLDLAVEATKEDVAMAIAEHDRYLRNS